jgi:hypothetical protein
MNHRSAGLVRTTLAIALVLAACGPAFAEAREIHDRFNIRFGIVGTDTTTDEPAEGTTRHPVQSVRLTP